MDLRWSELDAICSPSLEDDSLAVGRKKFFSVEKHGRRGACKVLTQEPKKQCGLCCTGSKQAESGKSVVS